MELEEVLTSGPDEEEKKRQQRRRHSALTTTTTSQASNRCTWLNALKKLNLDNTMVANLMCIAHHASNFNKYHRANDRAHGVFQVGAGLWCQCPKYPGQNHCHIPCSALRDQNLNDDIQCAVTVIKTQGYAAWGVWKQHCENKNLQEYLTCPTTC
ncbi:lysozyme C-1-like isoform X1 [Hyla sarda]|uniref:lysozyme C-1-like isoform X1 n=1 Tax=Hyla sarda TaxID=327740 RepID=UPI0024C23BAE|nr:lysozyme C-1-like isoform X1 [Hyla sarda]XP_056404256.1 lysozyme C-1-like isoform X1 [Hyla sarda]XP_056404257.1 lysozyme C-1-like isoform X1 [Hyla sarda]